MSIPKSCLGEGGGDIKRLLHTISTKLMNLMFRMNLFSVINFCKHNIDKIKQTLSILMVLKDFPSRFAPNLQILVYCTQITSLIFPFLKKTALFFFFCILYIFLVRSRSSSHAFNSNNDTH